MTRLKELREERGLNMREAADAIDIRYTTYVDYEKGRSEPNGAQLLSV